MDKTKVIMWIRNKKYFTKKMKYRNKSCVCRQGHMHDSIKEANYCDNLEILKKTGEIKDYEIQKTFELKVNGHKICGIRPDFVVTTNSGAKEIHEVKSYITMTPEWNIKRKLWEAIYTDMEYIVIR